MIKLNEKNINIYIYILKLFKAPILNFFINNFFNSI